MRINNKPIAVFMGGKPIDDGNLIYWINIEKPIPVNKLDYHENWNNMIAVCKRIFGDGCPNEKMYKIENRIQDGLSRADMDLVYTAVSDYIEEYNKIPDDVDP